MHTGAWLPKGDFPYGQTAKATRWEADPRGAHVAGRMHGQTQSPLHIRLLLANQCEESSGLAKAKPQAKPLGVSAAAPAGPDYEATESINGRAKAEMFADFRIGEPDDVPEAVADYIKLFSEARPVFCLGHMTPEQYREEPLKANPSPLPPDERPHLPAALPPKEDRAATIRNFMSTFR